MRSVQIGDADSGAFRGAAWPSLYSSFLSFDPWMKQMVTRIDRYSLATVPIEQFFNTTKLGEGTGFIWKHLTRFYLVTNWHVITCRRFPTRENLLKHGRQTQSASSSV